MAEMIRQGKGARPSGLRLAKAELGMSIKMANRVATALEAS